MTLRPMARRRGASRAGSAASPSIGRVRRRAVLCPCFVCECGGRVPVFRRAPSV